jgi:AraC-like DNA-binding protein
MPRPLSPLQFKAVQMIASGQTEAEVADACRKSRSWVQQLKRREECKKLIRETQENVQETIQKTVQDTHLECVKKLTVERTQVFFETDIHSELQNAAIGAIRFLENTIYDPEVRYSDRIAAAKEIIKISGLEDVQKLHTEQQAKALKAEEKEKPKGLSDDVAAQIRRQILGMEV